jgi:hypothetical protein
VVSIETTPGVSIELTPFGWRRLALELELELEGSRCTPETRAGVAGASASNKAQGKGHATPDSGVVQGFVNAHGGGAAPRLCGRVEEGQYAAVIRPGLARLDEDETTSIRVTDSSGRKEGRQGSGLNPYPSAIRRAGELLRTIPAKANRPQKGGDPPPHQSSRAKAATAAGMSRDQGDQLT